MLYLIGYPDSENNWTGCFMRSLRQELTSNNVRFRELPPYDWSGSAIPVRQYLRVESNADDVWLFGWAHNPLIELLKYKQGRKFGLVVGIMANHFDPLVFTANAAVLPERLRLGLYDGLFAVSRWCRDCLVKSYPELAAKTTVTGLPLDFNTYTPYRCIAKEKGLIVFNQRFSPERLPVLELALARTLREKGHRVLHLSGFGREQLVSRMPELAPLLVQAEDAGLEFVYNSTKDAYYGQLARAETVITTSIADTLSVAMIEAICLGAVPVAPNAFCFPEYIHPDNLYTPFDLAEILRIAETRPLRYHDISQFSAAVAVERMLQVMGLTSF